MSGVYRKSIRLKRHFRTCIDNDEAGNVVGAPQHTEQEPKQHLNTKIKAPPCA